MVKVNGRYLDREQFKNYLLAEYKVKGQKKKTERAGKPLSFSIFNTIHNNILTVPIFAAVARLLMTRADPPHNIDNV